MVLQTIKEEDKMSEVTTDAKANGDLHSQANGQADGINDTTSVKDPNAVLAKNKELLDLIRKEKQSKSELMAQLKEIEQQKLSAEGKKDELIKSLQDELRTVKKDYGSTKAKYASKAVIDQISIKASQMGCINTKDLTKLMDVNGLSVSVVDDDYVVDEAALTQELEKAKKERSYLFKQSGPEIRDGTPSNKVATNGAPDFSKMTTKEIIEYSKKIDK